MAVAGLLLLLSSVVVFQWTLRRGVFRRYPHEQFLLLGAAAVIGLAASLRSPGPVPIGLFLIELASFLVFTWYMTLGARFPRGEVSVKAGERFPHFVLPDSQGNRFESESLVGRSSALYLFYRGDW